MTERMETSSGEHAKCTNCGGSQFEWGWVHPRGVKSFLLYSREDESTWWPFVGRRVRCRQCLGCNQIAFFSDKERCPLIIWPRFSVRALLIATTIVAIACFLIALVRGIR